MKKYAFGVDIGGTFCKFGLFETAGTLLDKWEIRTDTESGGKNILSNVAASLLDKMLDRRIETQDIQGIGLGIPGSWNRYDNTFSCPNLGWNHMPVEAVLYDKLHGIAVKAINDANAAALGESWQGASQGYQNSVMVTLGTGVGAGVILNGQLLVGAHGAAGEIGMLRVKTGDVCADEAWPVRERAAEKEMLWEGAGNSMEYYGSANGLVRLYHKYLRDKRGGRLRQECSFAESADFTAKDIFDAYKDGDKDAAEIVEAFVSILGSGLSQTACVLDPEIFVIGGGLSKAGTVLLNLIQQEFRKKAYEEYRNTEFALAKLGNDAGIYGCVKLVL